MSKEEEGRINSRVNTQEEGGRENICRSTENQETGWKEKEERMKTSPRFLGSRSPECSLLMSRYAARM